MTPATIALIAAAIQAAITLWQSAASVQTSGTNATPEMLAQLSTDMATAAAAHAAAQAALAADIAGTPPAA